MLECFQKNYGCYKYWQSSWKTWRRKRSVLHGHLLLPKGYCKVKNPYLPGFVQLFSPNHVLFIVVERNHNILVINAMKDLLPKTILHSFAYHSPNRHLFIYIVNGKWEIITLSLLVLLVNHFHSTSKLFQFSRNSKSIFCLLSLAVINN